MLQLHYFKQLITPINSFSRAILRHKRYISKGSCNKYLVINVIQTELKKPGCNAFHLYDGADIYITKLSGQSSLKYLITENKDLLVLLMYHTGYNSKPLYFKSNKK